jgi:hypothetical protein
VQPSSHWENKQNREVALPKHSNKSTSLEWSSFNNHPKSGQWHVGDRHTRHRNQNAYIKLQTRKMLGLDRWTMTSWAIPLAAFLFAQWLGVWSTGLVPSDTRKESSQRLATSERHIYAVALHLTGSMHGASIWWFAALLFFHLPPPLSTLSPAYPGRHSQEERIVTHLQRSD